MKHRLFIPILAFVLLAGCDRAFESGPPPVIEVIEPNLDEVQTDSSIPVRIRVESGSDVLGVRVGNVTFGAESEIDEWSGVLSLEKGYNAFEVLTVRQSAPVIADTLEVFHMEMDITEPVSMLPSPLGGHTATLLDDGRLMLAGGSRTASEGAISGSWLGTMPSGPFVPTPDNFHVPRNGHTAVKLPDGRVLLLGGGYFGLTLAVLELAPEPDIFDPSTGLTEPVSFVGDPIRRQYHSAILRTEGSRILIDLFGGRGNIGGAGNRQLGIRQDLRTFEWVGETLTSVSPAIGSLIEPIAGHSQILLDGSNSSSTHLILGFSYAGSIKPRALRFERSSVIGLIIGDAPVPPFTTSRHAAVHLKPGIVAYFGGRHPETNVFSEEASVIYVDEARRYFLLPESVRTSLVPRYGHTATLLPDNRILLIGGFDEQSSGLRTIETVTFSLD